jgi:DNA-binding ferritin-like protein (Dps family)
MAKLRTYEIDAIVNTIQNKYKEKRDLKVKQIADSIILDDNQELLLAKIEQYNATQKALNDLEMEVGDLYVNIFPDVYKWGWRHTTADTIKERIARDTLKETFDIRDIKNELIIHNIEGNDVANFIDEVLNRFNFDD